MPFCCAEMTRQVQHTCADHPDLSECPDALIVHDPDSGQFGMRVHDGGTSHLTISHCPWCGVDLQTQITSKTLGKPSLRVANFQLWIHGRQFPDSDDYDDGNWLRITAHCGGAGASAWVHGAVLTVVDIAGLGKECESLYAGTRQTATLEPLEPDLSLFIESIDRAGHLRVTVDITPDLMFQRHRFEFQIDQTFLPAIILDCAEVLRAFPIRGL